MIAVDGLFVVVVVDKTVYDARPVNDSVYTSREKALQRVFQLNACRHNGHPQYEAHFEAFMPNVPGRYA